MTRQQIIDLIDAYIYTNGEQRISAAQLREILLEIASAFAMDGPASGLDAVLETGNQVSNGRTITNGQDGSVLLAATGDNAGTDFRYVGLQNLLPQYQGFAFVGDKYTITGTLKRDDPSRDLFAMSNGVLLEGEVVATTTYVADNVGESQPGIVSSVTTYNEQVFNYMNSNSVITRVGGIGRDIDSSTVRQQKNQYQQRIVEGVNQFGSVLNKSGETWANESGEIVKINADGLAVKSGSTELTFAVDGMGGVISSKGRNALTVNSNLVTFKTTGTPFATFSTSTTLLNTELTARGVRSTVDMSGTENVAVYASAVSGTTNTAFMAESGNLVVKQGAASFGFGENVEPQAKVDIRSQGETASDIALRVRDKADTKNLFEVRGDGDMTLGSGKILFGHDVTLYVSEETGSSAPYFRTGAGAEIRLYQETTGVDGAVLVTDREGKALTDKDTFDGYTLKQVVRALRNQGLLD